MIYFSFLNIVIHILEEQHSSSSKLSVMDFGAEGAIIGINQHYSYFLLFQIMIFFFVFSTPSLVVIESFNNDFFLILFFDFSRHYFLIGNTRFEVFRQYLWAFNIDIKITLLAKMDKQSQNQRVYFHYNCLFLIGLSNGH